MLQTNKPTNQQGKFQMANVIASFSTIKSETASTSTAAPSINNTQGTSMLLNLIPSNKNESTKSAESKQARRDALGNFATANNFSFVPSISQLVIVRTAGDAPSLPKAAFTALTEAGIELIGQKVDAEGTVRGADLNLLNTFHTTPWDEVLHADVMTIALADLPLLLATNLAAQMVKWSNEQYAEFVSLFAPRSSVNGSAVTFASLGDDGKLDRHTTVIDFAESTIKVGLSEARKANAYVEISTVIFDSRFILFLLACEVSKSVDATQLRGKIANLTSLWLRKDEYGLNLTVEAPNDPARIVMDNLCLPLALTKGNSNWPWLGLANASFQVESLEGFMQAEGVVAIDKYGLKWVTLRKGAEAMMLGRSGDLILNPHDANKASKFFNRPTQAFKFSKASSVDRKESSLTIALSDGTFANPGGIPFMTAFSNSRLAMGSGVAVINPGKFINYTVRKQLMGEVNILRLAPSIREALFTDTGSNGLGEDRQPIEILRSELDKLCSALVTEGKTFGPGEVILGFSKGKNVIIKNNYKNQDLKVVGYKLDIPNTFMSDAEVIKVALEMEITGADQCLKLRGMGVKLTTLPYDVAGCSKPWELMLNIETAKGKLGLVHLYVIANGGGTYYPNEGTIVLKDKTVVSLREKTNAFTTWCDATSIDEVITMSIAKAEWDIIAQCNPNADDVRVIADHGTHVVVEEKVEVIYGDLTFDVEVSTPRENTGSSGLTLEQLACTSLQNPKLAEVLNNESLDYKSTVEKLVGTVVGDSSLLPNFNVNKSADRQALRAAVALKGYASDRDIISAVAKAFPGGLTLTSTSNMPGNPDVTLVVNAEVLSKIGGFMGDAASQVTGNVVVILSYLLNEAMEKEAVGLDNRLYRWVKFAASSMTTWLKKMAKAGGILKRLGRTKEVLVNGKVKTSYHPMLQPGTDGLPVIILHPDCSMIQLLGVKEGDIVGIGRTPMPFITACKVKFSSVAGFIGHVVLLPTVWAAANEGDSDGDGIFTLNLSGRGVTEADALAMNAHLMGQAGYSAAYGADPVNWPYADFVSYSDKWGKKAVKVPAKALKPVITEMHEKTYRDNANVVSGHYKGAVGTSYGICSALSFHTANLAASEGVDAKLVHEYTLTSVVAWRLIYEGLGLSGYSTDANAFFNALHSSRKFDTCLEYRDAKGDRFNPALVTGTPEELAEKGYTAVKRPCVDVLVDLLMETSKGGLSAADARTVIEKIISMNRTRAAISAVERGYKVDPKLVGRAALFGALRRLGQGKYGVDASDEAEVPESAEDSPVCSTFKKCEQMGIAQDAGLASSILKDNLTRAISVHRQLAAQWVKDDQAEANGFED